MDDYQLEMLKNRLTAIRDGQSKQIQLQERLLEVFNKLAVQQATLIAQQELVLREIKGMREDLTPRINKSLPAKKYKNP
jgi:hypothetical protein